MYTSFTYSETEMLPFESRFKSTLMKDYSCMDFSHYQWHAHVLSKGTVGLQEGEVSNEIVILVLAAP